MEKKLTKSDFKILKEYDNQMRTARSGYAHDVYTSDVERLQPIYNKLGYYLSNKHCPNCVLNMLIELSKHYFKYIELENEKARKQSSASNDIGSGKQPAEIGDLVGRAVQPETNERDN